MVWEQELVDIVMNAKFMTLGTVGADGRPWVSPLVYGSDDEMRFYWVSASSARHSINIAERPSAALTIYDPEQIPNSGVQALYVDGVVEVLRAEELVVATEVFYRWRYSDEATFRQKHRGAEEFEGESPRRMYRLTPTETYGLDPAGDPVHGRLLDARVPVAITERFAARVRSAA